MVSLSNDIGPSGVGVASSCLMLSSGVMGRKDNVRAKKAGGRGIWALGWLACILLKGERVGTGGGGGAFLSLGVLGTLQPWEGQSLSSLQGPRCQNFRYRN